MASYKKKRKGPKVPNRRVRWAKDATARLARENQHLRDVAALLEARLGALDEVLRQARKHAPNDPALTQAIAAVSKPVAPPRRSYSNEFKQLAIKEYYRLERAGKVGLQVTEKYNIPEHTFRTWHNAWRAGEKFLGKQLTPYSDKTRLLKEAHSGIVGVQPEERAPDVPVQDMTPASRPSNTQEVKGRISLTASDYEIPEELLG